MTPKTTMLAVCGLGLLAADVFGFSTDGSSLTRNFNQSVSLPNQPIQVTVTFTNGGSNDLRGFFYTDQVPSALVVIPVSVRLNGRATTGRPRS